MSSLRRQCTHIQALWVRARPCPLRTELGLTLVPYLQHTGYTEEAPGSLESAEKATSVWLYTHQDFSFAYNGDQVRLSTPCRLRRILVPPAAAAARSAPHSLT